MVTELKIKQLGQVDLTTTSVTAIAVPAKRTRFLVQSIFVCNYLGTAVTTKLFQDKDGTDATNATCIYSQSDALSTKLDFPSGSGVVIDNPGTFYASCNTANAVCVTLYGMEIQHNA